MGALEDIAAERQRQIEKGYNQFHDDAHSFEELAAAAAAYAAAAVSVPYGPPSVWPWEREAFRPEGPRANMLKALALGVAAIERYDREWVRLNPPMRSRHG